MSSHVPSWLPVAITLIVAVFGSYLTWRQHRLESQKARLALYDRRFALYQRTIAFISRVTMDGRPDNAVLLEFRQIEDESYFLLGPDIAAYLRSLFTKALELRHAGRQIEAEYFATFSPERREEIIAKEAKLFAWFGEQSELARRAFARRLRLSSFL